LNVFVSRLAWGHMNEKIWFIWARRRKWLAHCPNKYMFGYEFVMIGQRSEKGRCIAQISSCSDSNWAKGNCLMLDFSKKHLFIKIFG